MLMQKLALLVFTALTAEAVYADQPEPITAFACDKSENEIVIVNTPNAKYDPPENYYSGGGPMTHYSPWKWVTITDDQNGTRITDSTYVDIECGLDRSTYTIYMKPKIFNGNVLGKCGVAISTSVSIVRGAEEILPYTDLQASCHDNKFIRRIRVREKQENGVLEITTHKHFYH